MWRRLTFNITFFWIIISQVSSSDPLDCDFETGFCNWVQRGNDELDWTRISGAASTNSTGPNGDHTTGDGFYAFIDTRPENIGNRNRAWLISQQKNTGTYCFSFWYFMYGNSVDTLRVSNASNGWKNMFDINGFQGQRWSLKTKTIFSYTTFRLIIFGILTFDDRGSYGIIAIDDILMFPGSCPQDCGTRNITNGYFTAVSGTTFGRTANQSCNVGYILKGPETVECTESGWNGTAGQCIIIDCSDPTPVSGNVNATNFQYKSQIEISCNTGYTLVGNSSIICQADGNWSNNPVCYPIESTNSNTLIVVYVTVPFVIVAFVIAVTTIKWRKRILRCVSIRRSQEDENKEYVNDTQLYNVDVLSQDDEYAVITDEIQTNTSALSIIDKVLKQSKKATKECENDHKQSAVETSAYCNLERQTVDRAEDERCYSVLKKEDMYNNDNCIASNNVYEQIVGTTPDFIVQ